MKTFRTSDGYLLTYTPSDGVWSDGDLIFDDVNGWPVDSSGHRLHGSITDGEPAMEWIPLCFIVLSACAITVVFVACLYLGVIR